MANTYALTPSAVGEAVYAAVLECSSTLRADCLAAEQEAYDRAIDADPASREASVLNAIVQNAFIGQDNRVPICQDTGSAWICLEVGEETPIPPGIFSHVETAVSHAYAEGRMRMSIVRDALFDRTNTNNNTPAFTEVRFVPGRAVKLHVMLKGGGSDNASRLVMLSPSAGADGIKREVLKCVREKAANACPPLLIGIGVGSTFDRVASLAKHALLREVGSPAIDEKHAAFEAELLEAVNATEIGPGALGGSPTALAVHLETAPCHIAALPLAINMGCCAMRSTTIELVDDDGHALANPTASTWQHLKM